MTAAEPPAGAQERPQAAVRAAAHAPHAPGVSQAATGPLSAGGYYDRRWLRVHPLCAALPGQSAVHGRDHATWEDRYYGDVIAAAHAARAHLWKDTHA